MTQAESCAQTNPITGKATSNTVQASPKACPHVYVSVGQGFFVRMPICMQCASQTMLAGRAGMSTCTSPPLPLSWFPQVISIALTTYKINPPLLELFDNDRFARYQG